MYETLIGTNVQEGTHPCRYVLTGRPVQGDPTIYTFDDRPTQELVKECGEGEYRLSRSDGQALRYFTVARSRNGNLKITSATPTGLEALSRLNIDRAVKLVARLARIWPEKAKDAKALEREIARREALIEQITTARTHAGATEEESGSSELAPNSSPAGVSVESKEEVSA
jgi:hypothetical protein